VQISSQIQQKIGRLFTQAIVECRDKRITAEELVKEFYDPKALEEVLEKYVK
jgi:hypothetical protein